MNIIPKIDKTKDVMNRLHKSILHYANKENREIAYNILKNNGVIAKKSNSSNQQIHPEYIEDYTGMIEIGFGNSMYQTFFKKLYNLEVQNE